MDSGGSSIFGRRVGSLPGGQAIDAWTLTGAGGLAGEVITYGGIVTKLFAPDRSGELADVVLGLSSAEAYVAGNSYFGAIIGRVAGRMRDARFTLDGIPYVLARNNPPNHLHGGLRGFDKRVWHAEPLNRPDGAPSLRLTYRSPDGEEGYPGTVDIAVTYTVSADNAFHIETVATTDRATPLSPTHHSYFNLGGESSGSIGDHLLQVLSDEVAPVDDEMTPLGRRVAVEGSANDFRCARLLVEVIPKLHRRHGALYATRYATRRSAIDPKSRTPVKICQLTHPPSGRVLTVITDENYLQVYTASGFNGTVIGKSGVGYGPHCGICLECEGYPDGANMPEMGNIILRPGETFRRTTIYKFSVDSAAGSKHEP